MPKSKKQKAGEKQVGKNSFPNPATQFKPGQSGNPAGYPKGVKNRSTIARKVLEMKGILPENLFQQIKAIYPEIEKTMTVEEMMTITVAAQAIKKGDHNAYKTILDSGYGNPNQTVSAPDGKPLFPDPYSDLTEEELKKKIEEKRRCREKNSSKN